MENKNNDADLKLLTEKFEAVLRGDEGTNDLVCVKITSRVMLENGKAVVFSPLQPEYTDVFEITSKDMHKYTSLNSAIRHMELYAFDFISLLADMIRVTYKKKDRYGIRLSTKYPKVKSLQLEIEFSVADKAGKIEKYPDTISIDDLNQMDIIMAYDNISSVLRSIPMKVKSAVLEHITK